jgi:hypothetical protein
LRKKKENDDMYTQKENAYLVRTIDSINTQAQAFKFWQKSNSESEAKLNFNAMLISKGRCTE